MNNQVNLIDQSKVDAYIEHRQRSGDGSDELRMLQEEMKAGKFDPDTPPVQLHTIKPGDTTDIKVFCGECNFECVIQYDAEEFVYPEGHCPNCGGAADLEVVE